VADGVDVGRRVTVASAVDVFPQTFKTLSLAPPPFEVDDRRVSLECPSSVLVSELTLVAPWSSG
jgi:hypothetical protein